jgi:hypothetical protein
MAAIGSTDTYDTTLWEPASISFGETPDPAEMETEVKKPLAERLVQDLTLKNTARYRLDRCLNIEGPTELYRQNVAQSLRNQSTLLGRVAVLGGIAACLTSSYWALAGCIGLVMLMSFKIGANSANIQFLDMPLYQKPAEQRTLGYQKSFPDILALDLKWTPLHNKGVLHPNEVEYLYKKYLDAFSQELLQENPSTDKEKTKWLYKFFTLNPLSPAMLEYGLKTLPPSIEQLGKEYDRLFPTTISNHILYSKFSGYVGAIGPTGAIGRRGLFEPSSYLYELEGLCVEHEKKLEEMKSSYLHRKSSLQKHYGDRLSKLSPESSSNQMVLLNDQYEYDLMTLKDSYIAKAEFLKASYQEALKQLKSQSVETEPHYLEETIEKKFAELDAVFNLEMKNLVYRDGLYEDARNLLERATKEFN